ncbi:multiple antibiotic resistance protein [Catalinimonas alkaloidigena]|nr:multiple antibiotic resistance protein [Catalinimonas alkaloidigena]
MSRLMNWHSLVGQQGMNLNWNLMLNFVAAMLAIVNPVGLVPFWSELMNDASRRVKLQVALLTTVTATVVLLIFLNVSHEVLSFFSIDVAVFKVAGGMLLFQTALSMIKGQATQLEEREEEGDTWFQISKQRFRKIIVPLVVPLLAGPGSITTVILFSSRANGPMDSLGLSAVLVVTMLMLFLIFTFSHLVEKNTDDLVFTVFTRILGVLVAAVAMQFVLEGLGEVFPNWLEGQSTFDNPDSLGASGNKGK